MSEIIVMTSILLFIIINILFIVIFKRVFRINSTFRNYLEISIIVAAKNEEENIFSLINSLQKLDYIEENFEVIIVDDNSSDKTYEVTKDLIRNNRNFHIYQVDAKELPAKKGALTFGIKKAKNPFILITDADCRPEKEWLKSYSEKFKDGFDFVFGNAPFIQNSLFVSKISCFENLRSSILTFTSAKVGIPYSSAARNFGFKKSSFEKVHGYSNTKETLSGDDDLLLREAVKNNMKIGIVSNKSSFVYSSTKSNFKKYFNQRTRHTKTSFYYLPGRQFILAAWHLLNLFFLFSIFLIFADKLFALLFLMKLLIDFILVKSLQKKFGYEFNNFEIIYLQIIYELFLVVHFINALFRKDKWK